MIYNNRQDRFFAYWICQISWITIGISEQGPFRKTFISDQHGLTGA